MAITLEDARAELAGLVGRFHKGVATGGDTDEIFDTDGLARFNTDEILAGCLAYIREDAGGLGAAPEGESRWITGYDVDSNSIELEYDLSAAVAVDDIYEVYLAPLSLDDWDACINVAIREAWPQVWSREVYEVDSTGSLTYILPEDAEDVEFVRLRMLGSRAGFPSQVVPHNVWALDGAPGVDDLNIRFSRAPAGLAVRLEIHYKGRYAELAAGEETDLDVPYLMMAARAEVYALLAAHASKLDRAAMEQFRRREMALGLREEVNNFSQMAAYWNQQAQERRDRLWRELTGVALGG